MNSFFITANNDWSFKLFKKVYSKSTFETWCVCIEKTDIVQIITSVKFRN
jgi:hypothetical protein